MATRADDAGRGREDHSNRCGTITLEAIRKHWNDLAEGHVRGKIVAKSTKLIRVSVGHKVLARATTSVVQASTF